MPSRSSEEDGQLSENSGSDQNARQEIVEVLQRRKRLASGNLERERKIWESFMFDGGRELTVEEREHIIHEIRKAIREGVKKREFWNSELIQKAFKRFIEYGEPFSESIQINEEEISKILDL